MNSSNPMLCLSSSCILCSRSLSFCTFSTNCLCSIPSSCFMLGFNGLFLLLVFWSFVALLSELQISVLAHLPLTLFFSFAPLTSYLHAIESVFFPQHLSLLRTSSSWLLRLWKNLSASIFLKVSFYCTPSFFFKYSPSFASSFFVKLPFYLTSSYVIKPSFIFISSFLSILLNSASSL